MQRIIQSTHTLAESEWVEQAYQSNSIRWHKTGIHKIFLSMEKCLLLVSLFLAILLTRCLLYFSHLILRSNSDARVLSLYSQYMKSLFLANSTQTRHVLDVIDTKRKHERIKESRSEGEKERQEMGYS